MQQPKSLFGPLFLIAAGAIWLLVKANSIPAANLWALTHIWPYLLIAAGVGIILRPYWKYTSLLMDVLVIGGVTLAVVFAPVLGWANPSMSFMVGDGDFYFGPGEPGSGKVISQTREVSGFDSIEVSFFAEVFISQGKTESVKVEAEDNVLPGLKTEVRGDTLHIFYKTGNDKHVRPTKPVKISIVVKDLKAVSFDGAGELSIAGLETDDLNVSASGAGTLRLNEITAKNLSVDLSGAGDVSASGSADNLDLTISGVGKFDGADLHSQTANASLSGVGSATVWVDDKLDAEISGVGSVSYYGAEDAVTKQIGGLGGVKYLGDK